MSFIRFGRFEGRPVNPSRGRLSFFSADHLKPSEELQELLPAEANGAAWEFAEWDTL
jgi:hypothetical protein